MEEATLFAEGPITVTTACVTGAGRTIALSEITEARVRLSPRPLRLVMGGLALGIAGFLIINLGATFPFPGLGPWLLIAGFLVLASGAAVLIAAVFQVLSLRRELILTVSGRNVALISSANVLLIREAAATITAALKAAPRSAPE